MTPDPIAESEPTDPRADGLPETRVAGPVAPVEPVATPDEPAVGMRVGEFVLLEELGRGAFGRVFLAAQEALNRKVALKVSRLRAMSAEEGKSLGGLEHDHIVKVYSAFTLPTTGWHCLCLQYVPGVDLRAVIDRLHRPGTVPASGRDILAAVDAAGRRNTTFDPAALRDRDALAGDDFPQAVCRLGGRLAEALAFAHAKGVLHCDIKPGNILLTPYGRPMLADFNVAFDRARKGDDAGLGGTRAYMAPEYEVALRERKPACVDGRCDVYSLGVVLHELATGVRPDQPNPGPLGRVPRELAAVVRRCLDPDPARRYQSSAELAAALAGAWQLLAARRALPPAGSIGRFVTAHPVAAFALAGILPHVAASVVNIAYNAVNIATRFTPERQGAFAAVVVAYNLIAYPLCGGIAVVLIRRVAKWLAALPRADGPAVDDLRRRVLHLGWWAIGLGALGWFPGGLVFPLAIDLAAGPVGWPTYAHFLVSFTLSGLIGVVFSYLGVQYVVLRALLPRVGNPDTFSPAAARAEVRPLTAPFGPFVLLASAIPLTGAVLLIALADGVMTLGFRLLAAGLIGLGASGVGLAERAVRRLNRLAAVWVGAGTHGEDEGTSSAPADPRLSGFHPSSGLSS